MSYKKIITDEMKDDSWTSGVNEDGRNCLLQMLKFDRQMEFNKHIFDGLGLEFRWGNVKNTELVPHLQNVIFNHFDFVHMQLIKPNQNQTKGAFFKNTELITDLELPSNIRHARVAIDLGFPNLDQPHSNKINQFEQMLDHALYLTPPIISIGCPQTKFGCLTLASIVNNRLRNLAKHSLFLFRIPLNYSEFVQQISETNKQNTGTPKKLEEIQLSRVLDGECINGGAHSSDSDVMSSGTITPPRDQSNTLQMDTVIDVNCLEQSAWIIWNNLRTLLTPDLRIAVNLIINDDLPEIIERDKWCGEPIRMISFTDDQFITSSKGKPKLPLATLDFARKISRCNSTRTSYSLFLPNNQERYEDYVKYFNIFRYQLQKSIETPRLLRYEDLLQNPLQPLSSNLESTTYETFESDHVKYIKYREAMSLALKKIGERKFKGNIDLYLAATNEKKVELTAKPLTLQRIVIMVVGAGRGPIVQACIEAIKISNIDQFPSTRIKIYAVEKNPSSVLTLKQRKKLDWSNSKEKYSVEIVESDMRVWRAPEKADLVVSELLGSFSDNELSPECIDGVEKYCKDETISIPQWYTSYIAPISSYKLYQELSSRVVTKPYIFDTIHVVKISNHYTIAEAKKLFTFSHTKLNVPTHKRDNRRYCFNQFESSTDTIIHGFSAYFEACLFADVIISTVPSNHTPSMHSWFPAFIPLERPVFVKRGEKIEVHFWRKQSSTHVWFEWVLTHPQQLKIQSADGRGTEMSKFC